MFSFRRDVRVMWMNSLVKAVHLVFMLSNTSKFYLVNYRNVMNGLRYRQSQNYRILIIVESG